MRYDDSDDDKTVFGFNGNGNSPNVPPEEEIWLVNVNSGKKMRILDQSKTRIGRGDDQDVYIPDAKKRISREHIVIYRDGKEIEIEVKGINGIVVDKQHFEAGRRTTFFPPFGIEIGEISINIYSDFDSTVTHPFKTNRPTQYAPGTANHHAHHSRDECGTDHQREHHTRWARRNSPNRNPSFDSRSDSDCPAEPSAWPEPHKLAQGRALDGDPFQPRPNLRPESIASPFEDNAPSTSPSGSGPLDSNKFSNPSPTFEPTPVDGQIIRTEAAHWNNKLGWGIGALTALLIVAMALLYALWPGSSQLADISPPASSPRMAISPTVPASSSVILDTARLHLDRARKFIESERWEEALYHLNSIPENSLLQQDVSELKAIIQRRKG